MSFLTTIAKNGRLILEKGMFLARKVSPKALTIIGVTGMVGGVALSSYAGVKADQIVSAASEELDAAKQKLTGDEEADKPVKAEIRHIKRHAFGQLAKWYGPVIGLTAASGACVVGGHAILNKRNIALVGAYEGLDAVFKRYRTRVQDELGMEADERYMYGEKGPVVERIESPENGVIEVTEGGPVTPSECSIYAKYFDESCSQWSNDINYINMWLKATENEMNDKLFANGFLFLNQVYKKLGIKPTKEGQYVGWLKSGDGDHHVSIHVVKWGGNPMKGEPYWALLDFNVDGPIIDRFVKEAK